MSIENIENNALEENIVPIEGEVEVLAKSNVSYKDLFTQKDFMKLAVANTVSNFGGAIIGLAFMWLMYEVTGSAALMAVNLMLQFIPDVLFSPVTGAIVDKLPKKPVMVICRFGRWAIVLGVAVLALFNVVTAPILLALTFLSSTIEAVRAPAGLAATPLVLDKEMYATGAGLSQSLSQVAELVGTAIAGIIIVFVGGAGGLIVGSSMFLISGTLVLTMSLKEQKSTEKISLQGVKKSFKEGVAYAKSSRVFVALLVLGMLLNGMLAPFSAFSVVFIVEYLYAGPGFMSAVKVALSVAAVVSSIITPKLQSIKNIYKYVASGILMGLCMVAIALLPQLSSMVLRQVFMIVGCVFAGVALGVLNVVLSTQFMQKIDKEFLGRMGGLTSSVLSAAMPVVAGACAILAATVSIPMVFLVSGLAIIVVFLVISRLKVYNEM